MRKISVWARQHRPLAIVFVIFIKLLLASIAWFLGAALQEMNIQIPLAVCFIALVILIVVAFFYPSRAMTRLSKNQFYFKQKICDLSIALCSFVMIGTLVNTNFTLLHSTALIASTPIVSNPPTAEEILSSLQYRDKNSLSKTEKRILKQEFKKQLKVFAKAKITGKKDNGAKALYITLTIIAALGLTYLLAALCCSIACSGAEVAAVVLAIVGLGAIIWGTIAIIRRIVQGPKEKKEPAPKTDTTL